MPEHRTSPPDPSLWTALRVFFSFRSPRSFAAVLAVVAAARLHIGNFTWWDLAVVPLLLAIQPFAEWAIHVYILHFKPKHLLGRTIDLDIAQAHRAHHRDPWVLEHVFIPQRGGWLGFLMLSGFWYTVLPSVELFSSMMLFTVVTTFAYEWIHYLTHTAYRPRTALYRHMWRYHRLHHFKNEHYWQGVTTNLGDRILGTFPDHTKVPNSPTCRTLGVE